MENVSLDEMLSAFSEHTKHPVAFLGIEEHLSEDLKFKIKNVYDFSKSEEEKIHSKSLKKLIIQDFDFEQIWQQIELQNDDIVNGAVKNLSTLLATKNNLIFNSLNGKFGENESNIVEDSSASDPDEEFEQAQVKFDSSSDEIEHMVKDECIGKQETSVLDDKFFKLNEMEAFLEKEEKSENTKKPFFESDDDDDDDGEEGYIDLFEEDSEQSGEDEAKTARFKDYFVAKEQKEPTSKRNRLMQELDEEQSDTEEETNELKSTLELRQERLQRKIEDLEEKAISEKPWQLKGEITAESRPQNSLLQEIVEFDLTSRPAPVITEQTSLQLEDIIRQRIKHKTFDDVEKISRPIDTPLEFRKKLVLDQEKSKESLANIYEKQYLEQQAALENYKMDVQEDEPETHKEVKKLMKSLFTKLDALSNFHFTSTPAIPELKIISNLPAVNMEEVAPVASSDATLLAPEEVRNKPKGEVIGKREKTSTDKKRERRKKKLKQKIHSKLKAKVDKTSKKPRVKM